MKFARELLLAALVLVAPAAVVMPSMAQVSDSDVSAAQSAIMSSGSRAAAVSRIGRVPSVGVVRLNVRGVPRFRNDSVPDVAEFRILAGKYASGIGKLRRALKANAVTRKALASHGISIGRVVGVKISSNGSLRVYLL